jgi:hypothetical protein
MIVGEDDESTCLVYTVHSYLLLHLLCELLFSFCVDRPGTKTEQ